MFYRQLPRTLYYTPVGIINQAHTQFFPATSASPSFLEKHMDQLEKTKELYWIIRRHRKTVELLNKIINETLKEAQQLYIKMPPAEYDEFATWYIEQEKQNIH